VRIHNSSRSRRAKPLTALTNGFGTAIAFAALGLLVAILLLGKLGGPAPTPAAEPAVTPADPIRGPES
jgi:hypothetical protein